MWTAQYYISLGRGRSSPPAALGAMDSAWCTHRRLSGTGGRKTILFTSDGSFHMNMNELATAVSNQLPLVIVLLNNNALGMVRQWQAMFFEQRYSNTSLARRTDYVRLAEAMGAVGFKVDTLSQLEPALAKAFAETGPVLIEVTIDQDAKVLPMIPPNGTIHDIILS